MLPWLGVDRELQGSGKDRGLQPPQICLSWGTQAAPLLSVSKISPVHPGETKLRLGDWRGQGDRGHLQHWTKWWELRLGDRELGGVRCSTGLPLPPQQAGRDSQVPLLLLSTFLPWCSR